MFKSIVLGQVNEKYRSQHTQTHTLTQMLKAEGSNTTHQNYREARVLFFGIQLSLIFPGGIVSRNPLGYQKSIDVQVSYTKQHQSTVSLLYLQVLHPSI